MESFLKEFEHLVIKLEEIKSATDNFNDNKVIGSGGFGKVYKGEISHSKGRSMVAIKRLNCKLGQGNPQFWKEIMMLSRYTHQNLISLLGYCDEGREKIIVYEHASNSSLDRHLSTTTFTCTQRIKVCLDAARGLSYLHDDTGTQQRVIHRDIKSSNILLDENWNAKLSDMGLSKIGPANQQHTALLTDIVGTFGYLDPVYLQMGILSKESDVYSFGVVLFEVLCGGLCYEKSNGSFATLVAKWKQCYKQKRLKEIVFPSMMQEMEPTSLDIFSDIAFQCLQKSREDRPLMAHVVENLEIALVIQVHHDLKQRVDYQEMVSSSGVELDTSLPKGVLYKGGKKWFSVTKTGKHCEMISIAECLIPAASESRRYLSNHNSRFAAGGYEIYPNEIYRTRIRTQLLSPLITYTVNIVFKFACKDTRNKTNLIHFNCKLEGDAKTSYEHLAHEREDGWLICELYQFTSDGRVVDLEILFDSFRHRVVVEGFEFIPVEQVEDGVFEDENVDMEPTLDLDTYWEQKLPNDYQDIIKCSNDTVQWVTKKEPYVILRKGFPTNNGQEWFYVANNGKKCYMLSTRELFRGHLCSWKCLPESRHDMSFCRFEQVAIDLVNNLSIICKIKSKMLSPQTKYASYLVYQLPQNTNKFKGPVKVYAKDVSSNDSGEPDFWCIYLVPPQTAVIRRKVGENTHNPSIRPKIKGIPQKRSDGWMEVPIWEFETGTTTDMISMSVNLYLAGAGQLYGLIVQGIEFKPIDSFS